MFGGFPLPGVGSSKGQTPKWSPAGKLPFFDLLEQHGVKKSDKLPYDCLIWFRIHSDK